MSWWLALLMVAWIVAGCEPIRAPVDAEEVIESSNLEEGTGATSTPSAEEALLPTVVVPEEPLVPTAELIATGLAVYRAQYCGVCHILDAAETQGTFGPTHNGMGVTAAQRILDPTYTGKARSAAEYLRESIVDPPIYIVPGYSMSSHRMPVYTHLPAADIEALTALLLAQR